MSLANKCDRCGKLYEYYLIGDDQPGRYNAVRVVRMSRSGEPLAQRDAWDLCPECMDELKKFMQGDNNNG